ncbi:BACK [Seminavis robusta]|uniref:BACK n=1 Tax=Seminavis robusta TaxID=568900 RepID=A0A9N8ENY2_9STRA|nr:BACK [Seminavis robusta]|eukprot:Sro1259_g256960.1 BACK (462) ;mRNA; f:27592-28977
MTDIHCDRFDLPHCEEISRDSCIASFLTNEALCDLTLKGSDGVTVIANRFWLAARSNVFRSMLLGDFLESKQDVIPLNYKGCVLKALVEYIVMDSPGILEGMDGKIDGAEADILISLMEAAMFFELPGLCKKCLYHISQALRKHPSSSITILEACQQAGPAVPTQLKDLAVGRLLGNIEKLDNDALPSLSAESLEEVLKCDTVHIDEFSLFEVLMHWVQGNKRDDDTSRGDKESPEALASQLVEKHIRLECIDPELLSTSVKSSGLVSQGLLCEAFEKQALVSKQQHHVVFKKARGTGMVVWENSSNEVSGTPRETTGCTSDCLRYPPISGGKHEWTLEYVQQSQGDLVGIALRGIDRSRSLGKQNAGWDLCRDGKARHHDTAVSRGHPRFSQGSRVTLTLNLLANQEGNGTLHASVDDGERFLVFENLRDELQGSDDGFVPGVSTYPEGKFRLLRIQQLH